MILRKISSFRGGVLLLLSLALVVGLVGWEAEPAEAIIGGKDADILGGQVEVVATFSSARSSDECSRTSGTLISPKWVLTAKHCVNKPRSELQEVEVSVGDKRRLRGEVIGVENVYENRTTDTALLELEREAPAEHVVGYSAQVPKIGDLIQIRGWGRTSQEGQPIVYPETLQEATMVVSSHSSSIGYAPARLEATPTAANEGITYKGDSGAGWYSEGLIRAVHSQGNGASWSIAAPTADIAPWIEETSGVGPSDAGQEGCSSAEPGDERSDSEDPDRSRDRSRDPSKGSYKGSGRGASGAEFGTAMADLTRSVQNADEDAKELVKDLGERYPGCNVMVIQQETYGEPRDIEGVEAKFQTDFGTNTWDAWVFETGSFTNEGDLGYDNWVWSGKWNRSEDKRTVTFEPIE